MPFTLVGQVLRSFIFGATMCKLIPYFQGKPNNSLLQRREGRRRMRRETQKVNGPTRIANILRSVSHYKRVYVSFT